MIASNSLLLDCEGIEVIPSAVSDPYQFGKRYLSNLTSNVVFVSVTPSDVSDEAKMMVNKVNSFRSLKEGWDSYGALPPSPATIDAAIRFIKKADRNLLPFYFAAPGPNGELVLEFRNGNREAAVYFNPEGTNELILTEQNEIRFEGSLDMNYRDLLDFMNG